MNTAQAFTDWFTATTGKPYWQEPDAIDITYHPPLIVAERYMSNGFKAAPGWPSDDAAAEADRLTDAEWKKTARFDDGSTFTPRDYRVQFLARVIEDEWSKVGPIDVVTGEPAPVVTDAAITEAYSRGKTAGIQYCRDLLAELA